MSSINTDEIIKSICKLCGITRKHGDETRVFSKQELLLVQATLIKHEHTIQELNEDHASVENIVSKTLEKLGVELEKVVEDAS